MSIILPITISITITVSLTISTINTNRVKLILIV